MRKNNHHSIPTTEVKSRVKMWRSGKNWVYGLLFFFGMAGISFSQANLVHADTTQLSAETEKGTIASQLTDRAVPLQASMSQSAADSTNTATSDSGADASKTGNDKTAEVSNTDTTSSDTTNTSATDLEPSTAGEQTESETTESPLSDPVNLSTTDSTDTTGATTQADSSTAIKSDAAPDAEQTDSDTTSSSENAETTSTDETADTVTPTTDQTELSASSDTPSTSETPVSDDVTAPVTDEASSSVDTSNTPLPEVSYKSMLSAAQANALAQTSGITSATDNASDPATTNGSADQTATNTNGLPEGFSVTDPDYPAGTFHHTVDDGSGLYSFFEGSNGSNIVSLSTNRNNISEIHVETLSADGTTVVSDHILASDEKFETAGFTVIDSGPSIDSIYIVGSGFKIDYDVDAYPDGNEGPWSGWASLKPLEQTQTTLYVDKAGNEIADPVKMTGLSGQKYTTASSAELEGYEATESSNSSGTMSPFMTKNQEFDEELYQDANTDAGTLTYILNDVNKGTMNVSFKTSNASWYIVGSKTLNHPVTETTKIWGLGYTIPNIYLDQTTTITYTYDASKVNVPIEFIDQDGDDFTPNGSVSSLIQMDFNADTTITAPSIIGYTYDTSVSPTTNDNPVSYKVTDFKNPGTIRLHYTANDETVTVNHVNAKNDPIGTVTDITGKYNDTLTVDEGTDANWDIKGYQATGPVSHTFSDEEGQAVTVQYAQTAKVSLNYVVDHADGTTTNLDAAQLGLQTQLTGVVDTSVLIDSPEIPGYTAVSTTPLNHTLVVGGDDVTLHYTANEVGVEVDFVDSQTGDTVRAPITQTVNPGAAVQIKLAGADHIPVPGYVFPQKKVPDGGTLEPLADGSIVINMTAPADGVGKAIVYVDPTKTVDATDKPTSGTDNSKEYQIYRLTNRVVTIKATTPDGSDFVATNGTQTVNYKRQYTYDVYIGPDSAVAFGEWQVSGNDLAAITSASPDGYTKTITLSTNSGTPVTMTDDGAVNDQIQKDLTALLSLPKSGMLPNETNEAINITYTVAQHQLTVHFINNADNSEIGTQIFEGPTNGQIDFSTLKDTNGQPLNKAVEGYVLVDDQTTGLTTFSATDPQDANLYYTPITGNFSVAVPNASTPTEIPYANDPADPHLISAGTTPVISGYTAYIDGPDGPIDLATTDDGNYIIPAPDDPTSTTTVKFRENDVIVTVTVRFVDVTDYKNVLKADQIFSGANNTKIDYTHDINGNALDRYVEGYLLMFDSTTSISNYDKSDNTQREPAILYRPVDTFTYQTPNDQPTTTSYQTDPNNPSAEFGTVPYVEGFTPTSTTIETFTPVQSPDGEITSYTFVPTTPAAVDTIQYRADSQKMLVHFKNTDNESIATDVTVTGGSETSINYDKVAKFIDGYVYDAGASALTNPLDSDDGVTQEATLIYNAVGKYTITTPEGKTTDPTPYTTDPDDPSTATGHIPYTPGFTPQINGNDIPLIDKGNPNKGYDFTPADPTQPTIITYAANDQKLTVHFKNTDNETIAADVNVTGESASTIDYDTIAKSIDDYVYDADASELTNPLDTDDDVTQEATLIYKASGDYTYTTPGTDTPTTTTYITDPKDPSVATGHIPYAPGFTPQINGNDIPLIDKGNPNKGYDFTPADPTQPTTITYAANDQKLTVHFKNTDNETIAADVTVTGDSESTIDYDTIAKTIDGYVYDADASELTNPLDNIDDTDQEATLIYKASGKYTYTTPGTDTPTTTTYTTDPKDPSAVTGHVPYTPGFTPQINDKDIPLIDPTDPNKGYDFTSENPTQSTTITYAANDQTLTVHFETDDGTEISGKATLQGASGGPVDYSKVNKQLTGFILKTDGTLSTTKYDTDDDQDQSVILTYAVLGDGVTVTTPTGEETTTPYTNDSTEPKDPKTVDPITIPYVPGYTPTSNNGDVTTVKDPEGNTTGYTLIPANPTQSTDVKYDADAKNFFVAFVDESGLNTALKPKQNLNGVTDGDIDYATVEKVISGHVLITDPTIGKTKFTATDNGETLTLVYKQIGNGVTLTTPDPENPDGQQTTKAYTNNPTDPSTVLPIDVPYIPGYTPTTPEEEGVVEPKDPKDLTQGYTFTPSNPAQPASVTYNANRKSIKVAFVDNADKQEIAGHPAIELPGATDETIDYTKINKLIDGYVLVNDGTKGKTTFSANDDGTPFTILYNEIGTGVILTTPDPDDPDGQQTIKTYTNNPTDPSTVLPIDVPYIPGYTPTTPEDEGVVEPKDPKDLTKGYTFTPSNPAQPASVTYNADQKSIKVAFINNADKQEIAGHPSIELPGATDETIDYTKINKLIDGYVLVSDGTKDKTTFAANDDGTPFTILYNEIGTGVTLTTPDPDDPDGQQTIKTYTNNPTDPSTVLPIDVPYIPGYTPTTPETVGKVEPKDPDDPTKGYTFTPKDPAHPASVKYNADSKNLNVVFVDQADPATLLKPTQNLSGVTDGDIDYTTVEKVIDGYVLLTDETAGKTKFTDTDNGEKLTLTYQKTTGGYVGKTPAGVDLTTPYVTDPEDPKTVQPITIPTVPGYTLDIENGKRTPVDDNDPSKGYTVTPIDPSKPTTVTYTPETGKSVQVAYVDENGVEIAGHPVKTLSGQTDQTIDYGTKAIAGYVLTADGTLDKTKFSANDDGTLLTISYEKIVVTITKPTDDGNTETVPVTTTTPGHVDYIPGYTPKTDDGTALTPVDGDKTKGYTVPVPDDPTTNTTINYDPDAQTAQVVLVDTAGNPVTNDDGQSTYTFHGVTGQGIHEWEVDKKAAAYTISDDGTLHEFVYDNVDGNVQVVKIIYLKTTAFNDPDGGTTTLLTDGSGKVVSIDKKWGTDGGDTNILIENGVVTLTPNPDGTPRVLKTDVPDGDGTVTGTLGNDGNIILAQKTPDGTVTETITPDGQLSFSQVPAAVSPTPEAYYDTQTTHDPDGGTTMTKTNGNGDITAIDRNWPDGDHSHVDIDIDTGIATITETPAGGNPSEPVAVQPGTTATVGKMTLDNHDPINLTHAGTDGDSTIATITPDGKRTFTYTHTTDDPDGGKTTTTTNTDGDITTIDKDWGDGDHSHVDIDTDTGVVTFTETPAGGSPSEPLTLQPGESGKNGKTTLDNGKPDGNIVLTHPGTDGGKTTETITSDTSRSFSRQPGGVSTTLKDYFETQITHDPDGGTTTTKTNGDNDITTIDKDWGDGDHSHVDIDTDTGVATFTETPAGGSPSEPITVQPGESGKNGKTTLDNGEPDGNIVLTHQGTDGDKTTETITPDTSRSFSRQPGGVSTDASHYYTTQITHDPDGGTTTTKTNGDGDVTAIDKDWSDGDHSHIDIDTDTGIATITETPNGGEAGTPVEVQPGESGKNGKTTLDNGKPDGNIVLTHQGADGDRTTETITPDTSRSFSRQPGGVSTDASHYFETQITHDPDGGTTITKTNGDGDITTIDKDWGDGDHSHVDIDTDTGIATITETPKGGSPSEPVTVQPGESGKNGKTTLDNGEPDGNIVLTHQDTDEDKTTETITPDTSRSFSRQPAGVQTTKKDYFETQITHDPDGGTTTTKTNGDGDITTIDKDWGDGDHSHVDIDTGTGIATITETPNGGEAGTPVEIQPGESGKSGKTTLDSGEPDGNIVLTHRDTDGDKTTETITPDTNRSFSRQPGGVSTDASHYFETQITHDPDGGTTTTKTNGDGDITTIDKDWGDGDHSHVDINTGTGIAIITETPNGGEAGTPVEVQPGESGKNGKTTLDNGEPDGNIVLTHQGTDGDKTTETITPDTSRSFSRQPAGVSTDASHYFETQVTHDPDGGTTTTKTNGDGDITTIDKDWSDGDHSHVDIDTGTGIATITETPAGGSPSEPIEVQPGESGKNGKTKLDNGEPDGNIVLTHQGTDGDKTTETITPDTSRSFSRQPGGVSTDASHYYTTQVTHDPDGGTTTTKTNGDGDITTIDKDWGDGDHSHVDIDTGTGIATITETPNGGEAGAPIVVQPGESGKNGKTTLDNGEPDGNIVLTHQGTDGDKTTETIAPDTSRSFSRMPSPVFVTADDFYDARTTHDSDGGTTTTVTNGNSDVTTIDKDWGDGSHTHVTVDPNTGDATATDTDENGNTSTPVTVKPGETGTTGQTTITNGRPDGDIILSHEGTDGDQVEAAIGDDGHVRVSLPDTDAEAKAETNVAVTSTPGSTTSANHANLPQTSATSRTDVEGKKSTTTQLPETGDKQNSLGLIGATLLAGLAMLGFGKRRRDDED